MCVIVHCIYQSLTTTLTTTIKNNVIHKICFIVSLNPIKKDNDDDDSTDNDNHHAFIKDENVYENKYTTVLSDTEMWTETNRWVIREYKLAVS